MGEWSVLTVVGYLAVGGFAALIYFWPWLLAWVDVSDPSHKQRTAYLNTVLDREGDVPARLHGGRMAKLGRSEIAGVGASTCARAYDCVSSGSRRRSGCRKVAVTFTCTYEVMAQGDIPATAIVVAQPNQFYDINSQFAYARETHTPTWLDLNEAGDKLCRLGYGC